MKNLKKNAGFTLVELIVVIAILGILAGVGTVAYTGYVEKANKAVDQQLVADVAYAMQLAYASGDLSDAGSGYIILGSTASTSGRKYDDAMERAFGDGWENLSLQYGKWTDDGLLSYVLDNSESASMIANSTFLTTSTTDGLMTAVTNLTDSAATFIKNYNGNVGEKLGTLLGQDFVTKLSNTGVTEDDDEYETVIANLMVGYFSDALNNSTKEAVLADSSFVGMAMQYATLYAYCDTIGDTTTMSDIDSWLAAANGSDLTTIALANYLNEKDSSFTTGYASYFRGGAGSNDIDAVLKIMGAVNLISGTHTDRDSLANPELYSSGSVSEQLNNYISAVKAVAEADCTSLQNLPAGTVVVFVAADGSISVVPGAAYLAA